MSDYWKKNETQLTIKDWLNYWDGCVACACDHGCNQWLAKNHPKSSLIMDALRKKKPKAELDKLAQMTIEESYKTWHKWTMQQNKIQMKALKKQEQKLAKEVIAKIGWEKIKKAGDELKFLDISERIKKRPEYASELGLQTYELAIAYEIGKNKRSKSSRS
jgi:hypothetical protein